MSAATACAGPPRTDLTLTPDGGATRDAVRMSELLEADRAFGRRAAGTDLVSGIIAMLAPDVTMPAPPGRFVRGVDSVRAALLANPANAGAKGTWAPVGGGISGDGTHGYTFGYMDVTNADGTRVPFKYLTYWTRTSRGWRAALYRRGRAADTGTRTTAQEPLVSAPFRGTPSVTTLAAARASLMDAERAFAREAQSIGLGAAFTKHGDARAMNMGGTAAAFTLGNEAIGRAVGGNGPTTSSPLNWGPDTAFVAPSGDLGVTLGFIVPNAPPAAGARPAGGSPFFTIWWRPDARSPWRYVAE